MIVKLLTERHLEFLSLKGGCRGSSESTLVKMSNCWKSHALAHIYMLKALRLVQLVSDTDLKTFFAITINFDVAKMAELPG